MAVYKATPKGEKGEILGQQQQRSNVTHAQRPILPNSRKRFQRKTKEANPVLEKSERKSKRSKKSIKGNKSRDRRTRDFSNEKRSMT